MWLENTTIAAVLTFVLLCYREEWKTAFSPRDLKAFSVEPLLVYPTLYTGEPGYFTDTEKSDLIDVKELAATKDEL